MSHNAHADLAPLYVILPANNEAEYIAACLEALLAQDGLAALQVIVAANACTDATVPITQEFVPRFEHMGWHLTCLDLPEPGKLGALRAAEAQIPADAARVYLDADVLCAPQLLQQLGAALSVAEPRYATGTLAVAPPKSWSTRQYARFWQRLPFVKGGAVGAGLFAVNGPGRARWEAFPDIISDDTFVRLHFTPAERIEVPALYHWPMVEGVRRLTRVRRRQDQGVAELRDRFPALLAHEGKAPLSKADYVRLALQDPVGFTVYTSVSLAVRLGRRERGWTRGR